MRRQGRGDVPWFRYHLAVRERDSTQPHHTQARTHIRTTVSLLLLLVLLLLLLILLLTHHDRFAVLLLGLRGSLGLRLFQLVDLVGVLPHDLYEVGHGEVHDVVFPSQLQDDVWVEEVVALEQTSSEAVVRLVLEEIRQQVLARQTVKYNIHKQELSNLGNFSIFGLSCILHRIFEEVVLQEKVVRIGNKV